MDGIVCSHYFLPKTVTGENVAFGVSVVLPAYNGANTIRKTITSILSQQVDVPLEILVVDDASSDNTRDVLNSFEEKDQITVLEGQGKGAAAAINVGIGRSQYALICQIDQDMELQEHWLQHMLSCLGEDTRVAAAQGTLAIDQNAAVLARMATLDVKDRHLRLGIETDQVCGGNSLYRKDALEQIGLFDVSLGYGYDNDVSYRLKAEGYVLKHCENARAIHRFPTHVGTYAKQQFGLGYGRLDVIQKHPARMFGDKVSGMNMILHAAATFVLLLLCCVQVLALWLGRTCLMPLFVAGGGLVALLLGERLVRGSCAAIRHQDCAGFLFAPMHMVRDVVWAVAIVFWVVRRVLKIPGRPVHSMWR